MRQKNPGPSAVSAWPGLHEEGLGESPRGNEKVAARRLPGGAPMRREEASARDLQSLLHRLVSLLGEVGIEATDLGDLVHVVVVGAFGIAGLDLDRLLEGLCREQLL